MRRLLLTGILMISIGCAVGPSIVASASSPPRYKGAVPASVSCNLSVTIKFSPKLTDVGGGTGVSKVSGRATSCTTSNGAVTVTGAKVIGSFAHSPIVCSGSSNGTAFIDLTVKWKGSVNGSLSAGGPSYNGTARFTTSDINASGEQIVTNGAGDEGINVPGAGSSISVYSGDTAAALAAMCKTRASGGSGKGISKLTLSGTMAVDSVTGYPVTGVSGTAGITAGPDGALWSTELVDDAILRVTTAGVTSTYFDPSINRPTAITVGPDGALWFTNMGNNSIGRITTGGVVSNYTDPSIDNPSAITAGPDGALWFTNMGNNSIGRITTGGVVSQYNDPSISQPGGIAAGSDGALWFTNPGNNSIGRITTGGIVSHYNDPTIAHPFEITAGPDAALWFINNSSIGRITTGGSVSSYTNPDIRGLSAITVGSDGSIWFAQYALCGSDCQAGLPSGIGRVSLSGIVSVYMGPQLTGGPTSITAGPDGAIWFGNLAGDPVGRLGP